MTIAAAMIRQPAVFYMQEKPKKIQRFLVANPIFQAIGDVEKNETSLETEPLLSANKERRTSILDVIIKNVKNTVPQLLNFKMKGLDVPSTNDANFEGEYTWWTKFYNSYKVVTRS